MPEAERRRRAPPSQIQITFTLRAKDQFSKERGRKRVRLPRGSENGRQWREAGSGERRAAGGPGGRGRGARSPRSWRGRKRGGRRAGGRASSRRARDSWAGRAQWPRRAGRRPLGSCYTAGAAAAAQPPRRARAARRGPRGHDRARGGLGARAALTLAQPSLRTQAVLQGTGPLPTRDQPACALPWPASQGRDAAAPLPGLLAPPCRLRPSGQLRPGHPSPVLSRLRGPDKI